MTTDVPGGSSAPIDAWVRGYERAWRSNDPDDVAALFAPDALYFRRPQDEPVAGRDAIVAFWVGEDDPADTAFTWSIAGVDGSRGFVEGRTVYPDGATYRNLWVVDLDVDGRAVRFTEWWMREREGAEY